MGVGKAWSKLLDIWSWSSLLSPGKNSKASMFAIFCIHAALRCVDKDHNTLDTVFKKMRWSFDAMWDGKHPRINWNGDPINSPKATYSRTDVLMS